MHAFLPTFLTTHAPPTKEATNHAKANTSSDLNFVWQHEALVQLDLSCISLDKTLFAGQKNFPKIGQKINTEQAFNSNNSINKI